MGIKSMGLNEITKEVGEEREEKRKRTKFQGLPNWQEERMKKDR